MDNPSEIVGAFWYGGRNFRLQRADGVELPVDKKGYIAEFQRLYPQRRLPWDGAQPTHAEME